MYALVLPNINQHKKCEVPSFANSKSTIGAKNFNKLVPYRTDGRLFTTDVSAKFKVM